MHFSGKIARTIAATAAAASVMAGTVALAGPAEAASSTKCRTSSRTFELPGKPDVRVSLSICAKYFGTWGGYRHYRAWLGKASWDGSSFWTGGKRFNDMSVNMRLEHGKTSIDTCEHGICEVQAVSGAINANESGSRSYSSTGYGSVGVKTKSRHWTGDANVSVDIADDGRGPRNWSLYGTPVVS
ncbi:hypothetical protein [Streptomyces sp. NEAU-S7GS2]|uniref:hypothetical protein n=1 Tax=Streptomyces sp. NEAU-S7GS2 TaxID=2202000 RepID=UPI000D6EB82F|nr:hypothetical protein [Streptomyces sp. NEAU-S7GS2]AWN24860.1 hypothetical protein DKG71_00530 [Streptomyces sp. NEAU-S7GS2]